MSRPWANLPRFLRLSRQYNHAVSPATRLARATASSDHTWSATKLVDASQHLVADVFPCDLEAKMPAVPHEPIEGQVIGDKAVPHLADFALFEKLDCRQQAVPKELASELRGSRCGFVVSGCEGSDAGQSGHAVVLLEGAVAAPMTSIFL